MNVFKGVLVQLGPELEEAGRVGGMGWFRTYRRIVVPLLLPTMVLIGMINFVAAAGTTSSVILLASNDTRTLSILGLQYGSGVAGAGGVESAGIISRHHRPDLGCRAADPMAVGQDGHPVHRRRGSRSYSRCLSRWEMR